MNDIDRKEANKPLVELIIILLNVTINKNNFVQKKINYNYLLNQTIRQYRIPKENWHITKEANALWQKITVACIDGYEYAETFEIKEDFSSISYNGTNKKQQSNKSYKKGDKIKFNTIFIAEHTVTVSDVVCALKNLNEKTEENVIKILDKMHITKMLKIEDRSIKRTSNRIKQYNRIKNKNLSLEETESKTIFDALKNEFYPFECN
ncbi:MAG: hypothetical protein J6R26_08400 [Paludibacteraceae bacterium]|nr:hypothetical protein [Paludibacteraceae bacterium]